MSDEQWSKPKRVKIAVSPDELYEFSAFLDAVSMVSGVSVDPKQGTIIGYLPIKKARAASHVWEDYAILMPMFQVECQIVEVPEGIYVFLKELYRGVEDHTVLVELDNRGIEARSFFFEPPEDFDSAADATTILLLN